VGSLEERELAVQSARAASKYLLDLLAIHDTTILDPELPEHVKDAYVTWRTHVDTIARILAQRDGADSSVGESRDMSMTLRAIVLALGFT
jgi:hypothetical protein